MTQEGHEVLYYFVVQIRDSALLKEKKKQTIKPNKTQKPEGTLTNQLRKINENIQLC